MKLLVAIVLALSAVDARSFIPKKVFEETYFDKDKYDILNKEWNTDLVNDVDSLKPVDYYRYILSGPKDMVKDDSVLIRKVVDTLSENKEKYDLDTFVRFFTTHPILSTLTKYFPLAGKDMPLTGLKNTYYSYPVPKEVYELVKTSSDLKDTLRTLVKHYYNLPEEVMTIVNHKYDFENVVKFLLQVYYNIPTVSHGLNSYYDIPTAVISDLKTHYNLKQVINHILSRYYEWSQVERELFTRRYFDVKSVVRTLIKVYYGVPQYDNADVEQYLHDFDFYLKKTTEEIISGKRDELVETVEEMLKRRMILSETEKEMYDRFFNMEEYLKTIVKTYYYAYTEVSKNTLVVDTPTVLKMKKNFFDLVTMVYKMNKTISGEMTSFTDDSMITKLFNFGTEMYPLEYYLNIIFGYGKMYNTIVPRDYYPWNNDYNKYNTMYKKGGLKGWLDAIMGGNYYPTTTGYGYGYDSHKHITDVLRKYGNNYYYPEGMKTYTGDYYYMWDIVVSNIMKGKYDYMTREYVKKIVDSYYYNGKFDMPLNYEIVKKMVEEYYVTKYGYYVPLIHEVAKKFWEVYTNKYDTTYNPYYSVFGKKYFENKYDTPLSWESSKYYDMPLNYDVLKTLFEGKYNTPLKYDDITKFFEGKYDMPINYSIMKKLYELKYNTPLKYDDVTKFFEGKYDTPVLKEFFEGKYEIPMKYSDILKFWEGKYNYNTPLNYGIYNKMFDSQKYFNTEDNYYFNKVFGPKKFPFYPTTTFDKDNTFVGKYPFYPTTTFDKDDSFVGKYIVNKYLNKNIDY